MDLFLVGVLSSAGPRCRFVFALEERIKLWVSTSTAQCSRRPIGNWRIEHSGQHQNFGLLGAFFKKTFRLESAASWKSRIHEPRFLPAHRCMAQVLGANWARRCIRQVQHDQVRKAFLKPQKHVAVGFGTQPNASLAERALRTRFMLSFRMEEIRLKTGCPTSQMLGSSPSTGGTGLGRILALHGTRSFRWFLPRIRCPLKAAERWAASF